MSAMDVNAPLVLLGGLSPAQFMRRHWQKKPLLVRQAWPGVKAPVTRAALFALAAEDGIESRCVQREGQGASERWRVRSGPLPRRSLPPVRQPNWTLLVQGLDHHSGAAHDLLSGFAFLPHARLDDVMLSWASDGGGVGPHLDSYDVFLLQVQGQRRWQVGAARSAKDAVWRDDVPLKILRNFRPQHDWLLTPGDMLYLPPGWAHDGTAEGGACMTASIGFRAPAAATLASEVLQRLADVALDSPNDQRGLYTDRQQPATETPGEIPLALMAFAQAAVARCLADPQALQQALGEVLSEPKPQVWFSPLPASRPQAAATTGIRLAAATRMLYDQRHIYINGESLRAAGRDARLMQRLADHRSLSAEDMKGLSAAARNVVMNWLQDGWLVPL